MLYAVWVLSLLLSDKAIDLIGHDNNGEMVWLSSSFLSFVSCYVSIKIFDWESRRIIELTEEQIEMQRKGQEAERAIHGYCLEDIPVDKSTRGAMGLTWAAMVIMLLCILPMPYWWYSAVRLFAPFLFGFLAIAEEKLGNFLEALIFTGLCFLFQPLIIITFSRTAWIAADILVVVFLLWVVLRNKLREMLEHRTPEQ